jgi:putative hemolysin
MSKPNSQPLDSAKECNTLLGFSKETGLVSVNFANPRTSRGRRINSFLRPVSRLMNIGWIQKIYSRMANDDRPDEFIFHKVLDALGIWVEFNRESLVDVPEEGPLLVISNHPLFIMDAIAVTSAIMPVRDDLKLLGISHLRAIPEIRERLILVKAGRAQRDMVKNRRAREASIEWLRDGHVLFTCPAGDISYSKSIFDTQTTDPRWRKGVAEIVRAGRAAVLPVFVHGETSRTFQIAKRIHTVLTWFLTPRELRLLENSTIRFEIGRLIPFEELEGMGDDITLIEYLRDVTSVLSR